MAVIGTFGSFTAARMGIYASQTALNVTGNNIANINTKGYTRQRLDLVSLHSWGTARYASKMNQDIGYGVLTDGVSQLRDPFMDIRYRNEQANVGASETWLDSLQLLSHTLDEVGLGNDFGVLEKQFNDFKSQLQQLNGAVGTEEYDTTARSSAEVLCKLFNTYAKALDTVENSQLKNLKDEVTSVNTILTQIRSLNEEIREAGIHGAKALELRDARNVLIDDLSKYMKIDVSYDLEKIDEFNSVERININLADSGSPPIRLICGIYGTQLEMPDMAPMRNPEYNFDDPSDPKNFIQNATKDPVTGATIDPPKTVPLPKYVATVDNTTVPPTYTYTNNPVTEWQAMAEWEAAGADPAKKPVNDLNDPWAVQVDNALEGDENKGNDRLWMNIQPLVSAKGRVFRNSDGEESVRVDLGDNLLYGSLQSMREFITGKGEFSSELDLQYDKDALTTRGVPYYRKSLDALARKFAEMFNEANTVEAKDPADPNAPDPDPDGDDRMLFVMGYETERGANGVEKFKIRDDVTCDLVTGGGNAAPLVTEIANELQISEDDAKGYLTRVDLGGLSEDLQKEIRELQEKHLSEDGLGHGIPVKGGGILFSNNGDSDNWGKSGADGDVPITAANISIAKSWSTGDVRILNTKKFDLLPHSTADDNIAHMINMMESKYDYKPRDIYEDNDPNKPASEKRYFNGSYQERFADMNVILSVDQQTTTTLYESYSVKSLSLDNDRQSVSGVDLNDEATNMMVFQKSYAAACQLMTTLDSMLDKLINGTIRS